MANIIKYHVTIWWDRLWLLFNISFKVNPDSWHLRWLYFDKQLFVIGSTEVSVKRQIKQPSKKSTKNRLHRFVLQRSKCFHKKYKISLTIHPFEALSETARLLFIVDSRNFPARMSQKSTNPMPVPIVKMLPLNETDRMPQPLLREGIFLMAWKMPRKLTSILPSLTLALFECWPFRS